MKMNRRSAFLVDQARRYNSIDFIASDPISIPHRYDRKEDVEISGLCTALISWGRRDLIIRSAMEWMQRMDHRPYEFVMQASESELASLRTFVHRTFKDSDPVDLLRSLRQLYGSAGGMEAAFAVRDGEEDSSSAIVRFRNELLKQAHQKRFEKHLADPSSGSAAKRLHMFLRWMVRKDEVGVDLGIWTSIPMRKLMIPLDVHSGRVAREMGILKRKANDHQAVVEITRFSRSIFPEDPALMDYAFFGMGVDPEGDSST